MKLRLLVSLTFLAIGTVYSTSAVTLGPVVYTDKQYGFRVEYPSDWTSQSLSQLSGSIAKGARVRLFIMLTEGKEVSACTFSVTNFSASKQYPTSAIVSKMMEPGAYEDVLRETMPNGKILSIQRGTFGQEDAIDAVFTNTVPIKTFQIHQKGVMAATVRNGDFFQGTCFSDDYAFPKMERLLRAILKTFAFT